MYFYNVLNKEKCPLVSHLMVCIQTLKDAKIKIKICRIIYGAETASTGRIIAVSQEPKNQM